jgi:hypothetical protein
MCFRSSAAGEKLNEPLAPLFNPTLYNVPYDEAVSTQAAGNWGLQRSNEEAEEVLTTSIFSHGSDTSPTNTLSERMADLGGNFTGTSRLLATSEKAFC